MEKHNIKGALNGSTGSLSFKEMFQSMNETLAGSNFISDHVLNTSGPDDVVVKNTLEMHAELNGISIEEAREILDKAVQDIKDKDKGLELTKNSLENAYETESFALIQKGDISKQLDFIERKYGISKDDILDREYFFDLVRYVIAENSSFFPLKNPFETKAVKPFFFLVPDMLPSMTDKQLQSSAKTCKTAFCTPKAEMVFQRSFFESLAAHAILKEVKPKSKKYKCNGGEIPDWYCYLEFVIIHELMHFSVGDHFYTAPLSKKIAQEHPKVAGHSHVILNYAGDFVNNWNIVKAGYEQLPMGLFSDQINLDKQKSYGDVIDSIIKDLETLNPEEAKETTEQMSNSQDDHVDNEDSEPSQGGQGEKGESGDQGQPSQTRQDQSDTGGSGDSEDSDKVDKSDSTSSQGQGQSGSQDSESKPGKGQSGEEDSDTQDSQSVQGQGQGGSQGSGGAQDAKDAGAQDQMDKLDQAAKKAKEKSEQREDNKNNAADVLNKVDDDSTSTAELKKALGAASAAIDLNVEAKATINWKILLKKMIPTKAGDMEDTYSKMDRSSSSTMLSAKQTGMGRIKPGEIEGEPEKTGLVFVIDTSGSVMSVVNNFMKQIFMLVDKNKDLIDFMYIIKFSSTFEVLKVDLNNKIAQEFVNSKNIDEIIKGTSKIDHDVKLKGSKIPLLKVLSTGYGAGTNMTPALFKTIEKLHESGGNVIVFTDDDLCSGQENLQYTRKLYLLGKSRTNSMAIFLTDRNSHGNMEKTYGKYKWVSVLE